LGGAQKKGKIYNGDLCNSPGVKRVQRKPIGAIPGDTKKDHRWVVTRGR